MNSLYLTSVGGKIRNIVENNGKRIAVPSRPLTDQNPRAISGFFGVVCPAWAITIG